MIRRYPGWSRHILFTEAKHVSGSFQCISMEGTVVCIHMTRLGIPVGKPKKSRVVGWCEGAG